MERRHGFHKASHCHSEQLAANLTDFVHRASATLGAIQTYERGKCKNVRAVTALACVKIVGPLYGFESMKFGTPREVSPGNVDVKDHLLKIR